MGPNNNTRDLYMINPETGERVTVGYIRDLDDLAEERGGAENLRLAVQSPITVTFRAPKHLRCRTRKRFIKLLMSHGVPRDIANWDAKIVQTYGLTYQMAWHSALLDLLFGRSLLE